MTATSNEMSAVLSAVLALAHRLTGEYLVVRVRRENGDWVEAGLPDARWEPNAASPAVASTQTAGPEE